MVGSCDMKIWKKAPYKYKKTTRVKMIDFHHIYLSCTARVMNGQTSGAVINILFNITTFNFVKKNSIFFDKK